MKTKLIRQCYNLIGLVILFAFLLCLALLISFDYSTLSRGRNGALIPLVSKFADSINSSQNSKHHHNFRELSKENQNTSDLDQCFGKYIYVHDLPKRFNDDVVNNCTQLCKWFDMCPFVKNSGLGPQVKNSQGVLLLNNGWFSTNQFTLELIFHERMKQYRCLTNDSSIASAIYVPYYPGLDVGRYLWGDDYSMKDSLSIDMCNWLVNQPEWKRMWGRDHFFVAGRIAWDFHRQSDNHFEWGSKLNTFPEFMNMTMLTIESSFRSNEFAIPYPSNFHPSSKGEVLEWQNKMRNRTRQYLFSFAGKQRPSMKDSVRSQIIRQCLASATFCKLIECFPNPEGTTCDNPVAVVEVFQDSVFCLQPPGDSYTRRSTFDSIMAGCIPVFFHPSSAYDQYQWHLPKNTSKYSVFIPMDDVRDGKVSINMTLDQVSKDDIWAMREEVIRLIPNIVYANPRSRMESLEDAFSIAIKGVLERIGNIRKITWEGKDPSLDIE